MVSDYIIPTWLSPLGNTQNEQKKCFLHSYLVAGHRNDRKFTKATKTEGKYTHRIITKCNCRNSHHPHPQMRCITSDNIPQKFRPRKLVLFPLAEQTENMFEERVSCNRNSVKNRLRLTNHAQISRCREIITLSPPFERLKAILPMNTKNIASVCFVVNLLLHENYSIIFADTNALGFDPEIVSAM